MESIRLVARNGEDTPKHVIAYAGGYFEIFETLSFVHLVLVLSPAVPARLRHWLEDYLSRVTKPD